MSRQSGAEADASRSAARRRSHPGPTAPEPSMIVVGKDVLELLSTAMYVDPLSIYREYVQNSADAIDDARAAGTLADDAAGRVQIDMDPDARTIRIRDNGSGIPNRFAAERLLAIGASPKRGGRARGFRGVGRLAGLAYGRSLVFRTRSRGDDEVVELVWDCQHLKAALREVRQSDDISSVIRRVVSIRRLEGADWPDSFMEVELTGVVRTKHDALLNPAAVRDYLEQVAPVPFGESFSWVATLGQHLASVRTGNLEILLGEGCQPLRRPFADGFQVSEVLSDQFEEPELFALRDLDGGIAAVGWVLHHGYQGSITVRSRIAGLRARVGNIQIGGPDLFDEIFPEARFNGWTVGEVHVLDPRILPNARRDQFEQNIHYSNLTAQLEPLARRIARRARAASIARNRARRASAGTLPEPLAPARLQIDEADCEPVRPASTPATPPQTGLSAAEVSGLSSRQMSLMARVREAILESDLRAGEVRQVLDALAAEVR